MAKKHKIWPVGRKNETVEYKKKFLTERPAKDHMAIYVDKDIYEKVRFVVGLSEGKEQSYGGLVSAVLEEHLHDYADIIKDLYNERQEEALSILDN